MYMFSFHTPSPWSCPGAAHETPYAFQRWNHVNGTKQRRVRHGRGQFVQRLQDARKIQLQQPGVAVATKNNENNLVNENSYISKEK